VNPMAAAAVGSVLRWALAIGAGYLVKQGIWTADASTIYVEAASLAAISLGWSQWQKFAARRKLVTALSVALMSEHALDTHMASSVDLPSVLSPASAIPRP
jgi:hypothetical protein